MTTCQEIMTPNPRCHEATALVTLVAKTMKEDDLGPVPIVDKRDSMLLVGIVTDRDLTVQVLGNDLDPNSTSIKEVMSKNPISCKTDDDIEEAISLMERWQLRRIPIVDESHRLVGIIAQADIANRLGSSLKTAEIVEEISKSRQP